MTTLTIVASTNEVLVLEDTSCGKTYQIPKPPNVNIPVGTGVKIDINIINDQVIDQVIYTIEELNNMNVCLASKLKNGQKISVQSENNIVTYQVTKNNSQMFVCTCPAFKFHSDQDCKHIKAVTKK